MLLQWPLRLLPSQITNLIECFVGIKRIENYLMSEEIDTKYIKKNDKNIPDVAIKIQNGNFFWVDPEEKKKNEEAKEKGKGSNNNEKNNSKKEDTKTQKPEGNSGGQISLQMSSTIYTSTLQSLDDEETVKGGKQRPGSTVASLTDLLAEDEINKSDQNQDYYVLKDINLEIQKGSFVAFIGE